MKYTTHLSTYEMWRELGLIAVFCMVLFGVIPGWKRNIEKSNHMLFSFRAAVTKGRKYFRAGGSFHRVSSYEEFFVIVFFGCQKINYSDVENIKYNGKNELELSLRGSLARIWINGFDSDMDKLYAICKKKN